MRSIVLASLALGLGCLPTPAAPSLKAVHPASFDAELGAALSIETAGLVPSMTFDFDQPQNSAIPPVVVSAFLEAEGVRIDVVDVQWVDATHVTGTLTGPVAVGVYDLHLIEPRGTELVLSAALEALDCAEGDCSSLDGGATEDGGSTACGALNYRDRDGDGFGSGRARTYCGRGWVSRSGDCNDSDGLTFPGAPEICNRIDDDCDMTVDEGCASSQWTAVVAAGGQSNDMVSAVSEEVGSLWVTAGSKAFHFQTGVGLTEVSSMCPANLKAVWAESSGVEMGGGTPGMGRIAEQSLGGGCTNLRMVTEAPVAMVGFEEKYIAVLEDGRLLRWNRGEVPTISMQKLSSGDEVTDLHGVAPSQLFAVGSTQNGRNRRPAIWALQADGGWKEERPFSFGDSRARLLGVWALSSSDAIAVGEDGLILRRSASGWFGVSSGTGSDITSVRAFAPGRFYVTTSSGSVRQKSGSNWRTMFQSDAGVSLRDITGTQEDDLWAVGTRGSIVHSPSE